MEQADNFTNDQISVARAFWREFIHMGIMMTLAIGSGLIVALLLALPIVVQAEPQPTAFSAQVDAEPVSERQATPPGVPVPYPNGCCVIRR